MSKTEHNGTGREALHSEKFRIDARAFSRARLEPYLWRREMGGVSSLSRPRIFGLTYPQLGDHWVALCHFVRFRRMTRIPHLLGIEPKHDQTREFRVQLVSEIARILQIEPDIVQTDKPVEVSLPIHPARDGQTLFFANYRETTRHLVAHQFDGISHPHLNPDAEEVESFLDCVKDYQLTKIGKPLTLSESTDVLLHSKFFIGVSSGMSHLAASANTPTFIYLKGGIYHEEGIKTYKHLKRWNPYPGTAFFSNVKELKALLALVARVPALSVKTA